MIEALVVLAISGMALMLIFSMGSRATETGFRLGRSALGLADRSVSAESYRVLIEGLVLAPRNLPPGPFRLRSFAGSGASLTGDAILATSTACAPAGPARDLHLDITPSANGSQLACRVGAAAPIVLFEAPQTLTFQYSEDGETWLDDWTNTSAAPPPSSMESPTIVEQRLYVRISTETGGEELIALARSGRPQLYFSRQLDWTP